MGCLTVVVAAPPSGSPRYRLSSVCCCQETFLKQNKWLHWPVVMEVKENFVEVCQSKNNWSCSFQWMHPYVHTSKVNSCKVQKNNVYMFRGSLSRSGRDCSWESECWRRVWSPVSWRAKPAGRRCSGWWRSWTKRDGEPPAVQRLLIQSKWYWD